MSIELKPFTGPGSTPSRRRFWDRVQAAVMASQKVAGRHVTVAEHPGKGTVINVDDSRGRVPISGGGGAITCGVQRGITCDYTVAADFYRSVATGDHCCLPVEIHMTAITGSEPVGFNPGDFPTGCSPRGGIKGGSGGGAPLLTDCGNRLCYCSAIGDFQTWTSGWMTCQQQGDLHISVCPNVRSDTHAPCDPVIPLPPPITCDAVPCVGGPVDIFNTLAVGFGGAHLIDFIRPRAFLNLFRDMHTGNYTVIPTGYVMDTDGFCETYCYNPPQNRSGHTFLFAVCCLDYCRAGYAPIVLGPVLSGNSFDIDVTLAINGLIMSPDCWGGATTGFCLEGFCGCCGLSGTIHFNWHVNFH